MVMAAWVKKRQFERGIEIGRAEERKRVNTQLRTWADEAMNAQQQGKPIPFDQLPIEVKNDSEQSTEP